MRAYWALWWRAAVLTLAVRYLRRGWEKNPYRQDVIK